MSEDRKVVNLHVVEDGPPPPMGSNQKVLKTLRDALVDAEAAGWTEICIVMAKPLVGYQACVAVEEGGEDGEGRGSIFSLLGSLSMAEKLIKDIVTGEA